LEVESALEVGVASRRKQEKTGQAQASTRIILNPNRTSKNFSGPILKYSGDVVGDIRRLQDRANILGVFQGGLLKAGVWTRPGHPAPLPQRDASTHGKSR
jgi:hypothetical protein